MAIDDDLLLTPLLFSSGGNLPDPWQNGDIGTPTLAGDASYDSGTFTIHADGTDIDGSSDSFHFVYQPLDGDCHIIARIDSQSASAEDWNKVGVMIRDSLTPASAFTAVFVTGDHGLLALTRYSAGISTTPDSGPSTYTFPIWLAISRHDGNLFDLQYSTDGTNWVTITSLQITMGTTVYLGLAATSHNPGILDTATISQVIAVGDTPTDHTSLWPNTTIPSVPDSGDANSYTLGTAFRTVKPGQVTGVRFYKGSVDNIGPHVGSLWDLDTGEELAQVTFTDEVLGWNTAYYATPIPIEVGKWYVTSYTVPGGHYSGVNNYFADHGWDAYPLEAPATGEVPGGNGRFNDDRPFPFVPTYPNKTFGGSNYYADLVFEPTGPDEPWDMPKYPIDDENSVLPDGRPKYREHVTFVYGPNGLSYSISQVIPVKPNSETL